MIESKFKVGDTVRIIKYGHLIWVNKSSEESKLDFPILEERDSHIVFDMSPELVGKEGIVENIGIMSTYFTGQIRYSLKGLSKTSWYNEEQLELIEYE